jgi:site-specific recombinase XerD
MRRHLIELGLFSESQARSDPFFDVLIGFDQHLRDAHGVTLQTRHQRLATARNLLAWYRRQRADYPLADLSRADVLAACQEILARPVSTATKAKVSLALRSFLRYVRLAGLVAADFSEVVPTVMHYELASVPKHLSWDLVRKLVRSVDVSRAPGKRDRAILLLVGGLALRNGSIQRMELDHISWRTAELRIPQTKGGRELLLPLSQEIGDALSDYVLNERPRSASRIVFLRNHRPYGPFASSSTITAMIYGRLKAAGIATPGGAANLLRHSLATQLVNAEVPIKQISDAFGHASIDTTAIYTKVHYTALAEVALPFPTSEVA